MKNIQMDPGFGAARIGKKDFKNYLSKLRLERRGWSKQMILQFLGAPDGTFPNPNCRVKPILLYERKRVFKAERTAACKAAAKKAAIRRGRSSKAAEKRMEETIRSAIEFRISVPAFSAKGLKQAAVKNIKSNRLYGHLRDASGLGEEGIKDLMASFLFQQIYPRDFVVTAIGKRPGAFHAKSILEKRVRRAVAAKYPQLVRGLRGYSADDLKADSWEEAADRRNVAAKRVIHR